jgi:hypothetical protein
MNHAERSAQTTMIRARVAVRTGVPNGGSRLMPRRIRPRAGAAAFLAAAALAASLWLPIPSVPDAGRNAVLGQVERRLPGWDVDRLNPSWEGAYTVVATCAGRTLSFQYVPGHGLPRQDAWLQPSDEFARDRLRLVSDHRRYLIWFARGDDADTLSCSEELARHPEPDTRATFD